MAAACSEGDNGSGDHVGGDTAHWGYSTEDGPTVWGTMDPNWALCANGREQSPIDLSGAVGFILGDATLNLPSGQEVEVMNQQGVIKALDNGHTIQINVKEGETMTIGGKTYTLLQFHFHAPSEHTVGGAYYPMEMHFVHQSEDGALAVVAVLIEEGGENPGIAPLWAQLAKAPGTEATVQIGHGFADYLFAGDGGGIYHYDGSLTTPPCSEGVKWYLRKSPTQFSAAQIAAFTAVYDHNNRPVQALNGRLLQLDENPSITIE